MLVLANVASVGAHRAPLGVCGAVGFAALEGWVRYLDVVLDFGELVGISVLILLIAWTWAEAEIGRMGLRTSMPAALQGTSKARMVVRHKLVAVGEKDIRGDVVSSLGLERISNAR